MVEVGLNYEPMVFPPLKGEKAELSQIQKDILKL